MAVPTLLYRAECLKVAGRQNGGSEAAEMRFLRAVSGYRLIDHRCHEVIREELQIDVNSRIKYYQIKVARARGKNGATLITLTLQTQRQKRPRTPM
jgi:hypothetical protein